MQEIKNAKNAAVTAKVFGTAAAAAAVKCKGDSSKLHKNSMGYKIYQLSKGQQIQLNFLGNQSFLSGRMGIKSF